MKTLSRCEQITDEGIRYICSSTSAQENLHILELDNCSSVTDTSIDHLLACQNLRRLDIFDCQQISKNAVRKIQVDFFSKSKKPKLDFLFSDTFSRIKYSCLLRSSNSQRSHSSYRILSILLLYTLHSMCTSLLLHYRLTLYLSTLFSYFFLCLHFICINVSLSTSLFAFYSLEIIFFFVLCFWRIDWAIVFFVHNYLYTNIFFQQSVWFFLFIIWLFYSVFSFVPIRGCFLEKDYVIFSPSLFHYSVFLSACSDKWSRNKLNLIHNIPRCFEIKASIASFLLLKIKLTREEFG